MANPDVIPRSAATRDLLKVAKFFTAFGMTAKHLGQKRAEHTNHNQRKRRRRKMIRTARMKRFSAVLGALAMALVLLVPPVGALGRGLGRGISRL